MQIRKVLLCTDFSLPASHLPDCLPLLQEHGLTDVILIHVVNIRSAGGNADELQRHNKTALADLEEKLTAQGLRTDILVPIGFPPHEIVQAADDEDVDVILLGAIGKGIIRRIFMGSTAFDVIRMSNKPVLIEKFKETSGQEPIHSCHSKFDKILVPVDFSDDSIAVVNHVKGLVDARGQIILLHVIESSDNEKVRQAKHQKGLEDLQTIAEQLMAEGHRVVVHVREGAASTHIIRLADEEHATMVAIAKRGTGTIKGLLIGSTAEAVALRIPVPVLLFPSMKV